MHIEKNICENVIRTLLNIKRKPKEHLRTRLHSINIGPNKVFLLHAKFSLLVKEKDIFCRVLKGVKVPESYGTNVSRCVNLEQTKILGLKSHDFHILMQDWLKVAIQKVLSKEVTRVLMKLSSFFKILCSKVIIIEEFESFDVEIALILCELERIFPPFFLS